MSLKVNILGRTEEEQKLEDERLEERGSLFGLIPLLYLFMPIEKYFVFKFMQALKKASDSYLENFMDELRREGG